MTPLTPFCIVKAGTRRGGRAVVWGQYKKSGHLSREFFFFSKRCNMQMSECIILTKAVWLLLFMSSVFNYVFVSSYFDASF